MEFRADFLNIFNRTVFGYDQGGDQYGSVIQGTQISSGSWWVRACDQPEQFTTRDSVRVEDQLLALDSRNNWLTRG